jgi:hypothetical protein
VDLLPGDADQEVFITQAGPVGQAVLDHLESK